ncbi:AAA family ATPase [Cecembia calidifontis]|uniref:AAA family ATPase n=1 Tax=Cecembia calidifontis TaxID=1187080 RepID=UPI001A91D70D
MGKTTLSKLLADKTHKEIPYLDVRLPTDLAKLEEPELFLKQFKNHCIVIDEVQCKADLFPVLRALIDQYCMPGRIILL